jgi:DNA-binding response OmpR family regulator
VKKKILIIDDNVKEAESYALFLQQGNYQPLFANSAIDALKILNLNQRFWGFAKNKIKAVLLNLDLPDNESIMFLKMLRNEEHRRTFINFIPVITFSDIVDKKKLKIIVHSGHGMVAYFFKKPFNLKSLLSLLSRIFKTNELNLLIEETKNSVYLL